MTMRGVKGRRRNVL